MQMVGHQGEVIHGAVVMESRDFGPAGNDYVAKL
jgi:hypothetical protein